MLRSRSGQRSSRKPSLEKWKRVTDQVRNNLRHFSYFYRAEVKLTSPSLILSPVAPMTSYYPQETLRDLKKTEIKPEHLQVCSTYVV